MKIAVVSDIHGNLLALEAVVRDFASQGVGAVVNLGDSVSGPLMPLETAQYLMAQNWHHLAGNHERQLLNMTDKSGASDKFAHARLGVAELNWLATLTHSHQLLPDVLLCHGTPTSDCTSLLQTAERNATREEVEFRLAGTPASVIVCGHTHVPRAVRTASGHFIVNPGSVGHPAYADDYPHQHVVETGSPDARYAILERRDGAWKAVLRTVVYDHVAMAALARCNGRPDWEIALLTGYMS